MTCPRPDKQKFSSAAKARRYQRHYQSTWKARLWPYQCGDHWHLTNQNPQEQKRIADQIKDRTWP